MAEAELLLNRDEAAFAARVVSPTFYARRIDAPLPSGDAARAHFAEIGVYQGLSPNPLFDADWYRSQVGIGLSTPAFHHYIKRGLPRGLAPSAGLDRLAASRDIRFDPWKFFHISRNLRSDLPEGLDDPALLSVLANIFDADFYLSAEAARGIRLSGSPLEVFGRYLGDGLPSGQTFSRAFDIDLLGSKIGRSFEGPYRALNAIKAWGAVSETVDGVRRRVTAAADFDADYYLRTNPDLREKGGDPYGHYLSQGICEYRRPNAGPFHILPSRMTKVGYPRWNRFSLSTAERLGALAPPQTLAFVEALKSPVLRECVARAQAIESNLADLEDLQGIYAPPDNDPAYFIWLQILARLPKTPVKHLILVPWIKMGGADFVASQVARALNEAVPASEILIIKVDFPSNETFDWFAGLTVIDLVDVFGDVPPEMAQALMLQTIRLLAPRTVININSLLCWDLIERFGSQLGDICDVFAYLFTWDRTPTGRPVGYPDRLPGALRHVTRFFTDSVHLKNALVRKHALPPSVAEKIIPLFTPARSDLDRSRAAASQTARRTRPLVLWGGRFDRQKRVDILFDVARAMPNVDFHVWGKSVLGDYVMPDETPSNLTLRGQYRDYAELPLEEASCWLYTSDWDGIPTMLIDLALLGVPIVVSDVGGVGELLGWDGAALITKDAPVGDYVEAVRAFIEDPQLRAAKADFARARVAAAHAWPAYAQALAAGLGLGA